VVNELGDSLNELLLTSLAKQKRISSLLTGRIIALTAQHNLEGTHRNFPLALGDVGERRTQILVAARAEAQSHAPAAPWLWNFTSTSLRSSSDTWNIARGFRFMKLATKTSGIWPMRVL
jgi:hypothetical protein